MRQLRVRTPKGKSGPTISGRIRFRDRQTCIYRSRGRSFPADVRGVKLGMWLLVIRSSDDWV